MAFLLILISLLVLLNAGFSGFITYWILVGLVTLFFKAVEFSEDKGSFDDHDPTMYDPSWDDIDDCRDYD